jgi:hypothetical protein
MTREEFNKKCAGSISEVYRGTSTMKIIFLDIDGVLNSDYWYRTRHTKGHTNDADSETWDFDPRSIKALNNIISATQAKIVISSTWRLGKSLSELAELCAKVGIEGEIIGATPFISVQKLDIPRGMEIKQYLSKNCNWYYMPHNNKELAIQYIEGLTIDNYLILDDDSDMLYEQRKNFLLIHPSFGLSAGHEKEAINILNSPLLKLYYPNAEV